MQNNTSRCQDKSDKIWWKFWLHSPPMSLETYSFLYLIYISVCYSDYITSKIRKNKFKSRHILKNEFEQFCPYYTTSWNTIQVFHQMSSNFCTNLWPLSHSLQYLKMLNAIKIWLLIIMQLVIRSSLLTYCWLDWNVK